jgi:hypothetical protein
MAEVVLECVSKTYPNGVRAVRDLSLTIADGTRIEIRRTQPNDATPEIDSCATPQHEILEAFRWMRALIADGKAKPEEIAIAAASPVDFDDHVLALSQDANLPIHFVQGIKAVATTEGQTAAALADVLLARACAVPVTAAARHAHNRGSAARLAGRRRPIGTRSRHPACPGKGSRGRPGGWREAAAEAVA